MLPLFLQLLNLIFCNKYQSPISSCQDHFTSFSRLCQLYIPPLPRRHHTTSQHQYMYQACCAYTCTGNMSDSALTGVAHTDDHSRSLQICTWHCCNTFFLCMQDEVTNFRPRGSDLDYPAKLQQQQEQQQPSSSSPSTDQAPPTNQNGNTPAASVPQQNTDSQVGVSVHLPYKKNKSVYDRLSIGTVPTSPDCSLVVRQPNALLTMAVLGSALQAVHLNACMKYRM